MYMVRKNLCCDCKARKKLGYVIYKEGSEPITKLWCKACKRERTFFGDELISFPSVASVSEVERLVVQELKKLVTGRDSGYYIETARDFLCLVELAPETLEGESLSEKLKFFIESVKE